MILKGHVGTLKRSIGKKGILGHLLFFKCLLVIFLFFHTSFFLNRVDNFLLDRTIRSKSRRSVVQKPNLILSLLNRNNFLFLALTHLQKTSLLTLAFSLTHTHTHGDVTIQKVGRRKRSCN